MYFDVIGLPPTPEEVTAFARDFQRQPRRAVAALADKLLASPHYGERWARHWLDVVRFAESDGFETNQPRPNAWPYRDYVIRALNEDKPYDQFVREQLAGDTLGVDEATGFLVGGPWDRVKSPDPVLTANQRADELHDMVGVTGATFLALTVNCARCHNHKFDPIAQTDYYALKAVFAGVQHGERAVRPPDFAARQERAAALRPPLADVEQQLAQFEPLANLEPAPDAPRRAPVTRGRNVERFALVEAKFMRFTIHETTQLEPCLDELEVFTRDGRNVALAAAGARLASSGDYAGNPFHKLEHLHDGLYGNERSWISNERGRGWVRVEFARAEQIERVIWSRDREEVPRYNDRLATRYDVEVSSDGAAWQRVASSADRLPPGTKAGAEHTAKGLAAAEAARFTALLAERSALQTQIAGTIRPQMVYAGKLGPPEKTFRFHRGDPMQPRELAPPGGLSEFPAPWRLGETAADAERRLALAQWIAAPENPLTARVLVNRLWHYHFGNGLVDTPSDFGLNGGRPSHPELLDWLAGEFIARGWSLKALHRLILTSATYRQSSAPVAAALAVDAGDRLLWRFPPRRLEAEPLRDAILAVSGRLDLRQGGPGFDLFETNANYVKVYVTKTQFGPDDFRRMVYQNKPRAELDALFGAFDCPDAGQIQPRRTVSTTPLQALNLLNSEFLLEQARALAERLAREAGAAPAAQVRRAFALCFSREPHAEETAAATRLIAAHGLEIFCRALYNANEFILVF